MRGKKITTEQWVEKAKKVNGDKFDYSNVVYNGQYEKVLLKCNKCGYSFLKTPKRHLLGDGCKNCYILGSRKGTEQFIKESKEVHGDKYDYSLVNYTTAFNKVKLICPIHGEFETEPKGHIYKGYGCWKCSVEYRANNCRKSLEQFIEEANVIHNNYYDYSKVEYINTNTKICIICPKHGEFFQAPDGHLQGQGCPKCSIQKTTFNTKEWIEKASIVHDNKYNYNKVEYINSYSKVKILCSIHGEFEQLANSHLQGRGCPICNYSSGEHLIYKWLKENNIPFKVQFELVVDEIARNSNLIKIDFFIVHNNKQYFIEYDGKQHFEYVPHFHKNGMIDFEKQQRRDRILNEFCELHKDKVTLIRFDYTQEKEIIIKYLEDKFKK